jgi:tetratricopeptide (TPR) repeat protein
MGCHELPPPSPASPPRGKNDQEGQGAADDTAPRGGARGRGVAASEPDRATLIGRRAELRTLVNALDTALGGEAALVVLSGEAGIGKTRLTEELIVLARRAGVNVLVARCDGDEGRSAYGPWMHLARAALPTFDLERLRHEDGGDASDVVRLIAGLPTAEPAWPEPLAGEGSGRLRLFHAFTSFFVGLARHRPLVLVLEDVHAADPDSLLLLRFLVREIGSVPLLVLCTVRDTELSPPCPSGEALVELTRHPRCGRIALPGLGTIETADLVELLTGERAEPAVVDVLHARCAGNPFFLREIVISLAATGNLAAACVSQALPPTVRCAIAQRVRKYPAASQRLLALAAVVGREFSASVLACVSGCPIAAVVDALAGPVEQGILVAVSGSVDRYTFAHALVWQTLYDSLAPTERATTHRQVGETLEVLHGERAMAYASELALHFFEALPHGEVSRALVYAREAGKQASALHAHEEAAAYFEKALRCTEFMNEQAASAAALLVDLGHARRRAGDVGAARRAFQRGAVVAREAGAPRLMAEAALGMAASWLRPQIGSPDLRRLLERALAALPEVESSLRARVMAALAPQLQLLGDKSEALAQSAAALGLARRLDEPTTLARALHGRYWSLVEAEHLEERLEIGSELVRLGTRTGEPEWELMGYALRVADALEARDIAAVDDAIYNHARLAEELRQPHYLWWTKMFRGTRAMVNGRLASAARLADETFALGVRAEAPNAGIVLVIQRLIIALLRGTLTECRSELEAAAEAHPLLPQCRCALALVYCQQGLLVDARREFERLAADDFRAVGRGWQWICGAVLLAEVCAFFGDVERAAALHTILLPYARRGVVFGAAAGYFASTSYYLGLLAHTTGCFDEAVGHFDDDLDFHRRMGAAPFVAHTEYTYAAVLLARKADGDIAAACRRLTHTLEIGKAIDMPGLVERAEALRRRAEETATVEVSKEPPLRTLQEAFLRREGEYWAIGYAADVLRLKDCLGLRCLAHLLRHPGQEFLALDLVTAGRGDAPWSGDGAPTGERHGAGGVIDHAARAAYRRRIEELRDLEETAQGLGDTTRARRGRRDRIRRPRAAGDPRPRRPGARSPVPGRARTGQRDSCHQGGARADRDPRAGARAASQGHGQDGHGLPVRARPPHPDRLVRRLPGSRTRVSSALAVVRSY